MKKIFNICIAGLFVLQFIGCKDRALEDFALVDNNPVQVIAGDGTDEIIKTNDYVEVPITVMLSAPASKAFDVELVLSNDTIHTLLASNILKDVTTLPNTAYVFPNVVKFDYGTRTASFHMRIGRTAIEKVYGEKFAFAYKLVTPGKGNILGNPSTAILTIDSKDLLSAEDIHFLSFKSGGGEVWPIANHINYNPTTVGITIPLTVSLASFPGKAFTLDLATTADSIPQLIAQGKVPVNTVALKSEMYTISNKLQFPSNKSAISFDVSVPWSVINANKDKFLALTVNLKNPTLHVVDKAKDYTTLLIDCNGVLENDITSQATISVSRDNNNGQTSAEGSLKLIDNSHNTKFLQQNYNGDLWLMLTFQKPVRVGAYTLTSGNDAIDRDPKDWTLEGSLDGTNWVKIDERSNEAFPTRILTRRFTIQKPGSYLYYRLNVLNNVGSSIFQLTEWRMIEFQ